MGRICGGLLGQLEAQTCANPNAAADEVRFFKRRGTRTSNTFRLRPRTPVRQFAKRDRKEKTIPADVSTFNDNVEKFTKILSPVCGDDTLAVLLMSGYEYGSPMSRAIPVPVFAVDNEVKDDELESEVCKECMFCERERVRHHKTKNNENPVVRQLRSPCRCFHDCIMEDATADTDEPGGKKYILDRFLREKVHTTEFKIENDTEILSKEESVIDEVINKPDDVESENEVIQILNCETEAPRIQHLPSKDISEPRKRNCHSEISSLPPKRISVITPNATSEVSSSITRTTNKSTSVHHFKPKTNINDPKTAVVVVGNSRACSLTPNTRIYKNGPVFSTQLANSTKDSVIKIENPSSLEAYGMFTYRSPASTASSRSNYTLPGNGQESRSYLGGSIRSFRSEPPVQQFSIQPHQQQVYTQEEVNRMLTPGHPPRIRACIERLATRFAVSRTRPEHNEKQVTELLQLACEVRREEECETFYCTWQDCIKHFNRRDSLVRHLRVHVNVRPFKCERCDQRFLRSDHLRVHMLRHTGEQPFACIVCGLTFGRKDLRNRHMKTIHYPEERPPQRVLDLLDGIDWDSIEKDTELFRKA